jgi:hypothetical protein
MCVLESCCPPTQLPVDSLGMSGPMRLNLFWRLPYLSCYSVLRQDAGCAIRICSSPSNLGHLVGVLGMQASAFRCFSCT